MADSLTGLGVLPGAGPGAPVARLDQPALVPTGGPPAPAPMWDDVARQAMVLFLDGTWRLCRLTAWRPAGGGAWLCELRWGVSGRVVGGAYVYDAARVLRS